MSENKYNDAFFEKFEKMYSNTVEHIRREPIKRQAYKPDAAAVKVKKSKKKAKKGVIAAVSAVLAVAILTAGTVFVTKNVKNKNKTQPTEEAIPVVATAEEKYPYPKTDGDIKKIGKFIKSEYAVLVNVKDNAVVAGKNYDKKISPASLTKILTLLVAVENCQNLDDTFTITTDITDPLFIARASVAGFLNNETVTVRDLLYGAILPSGADATAALSIYTAGSEKKFAQMMTEKAKEIGLKNANFTNSSGLYGEKHYCTVLDMAQILKVAMENNTCRQVLSAVNYTTTKTKQHPDGITLTSTLFSRMVGDECVGAKIISGKTGYIDEAGNCIASYSVSDDGTPYIFVTTNAKGKWNAVFDHINVYSKYVGKSDKVIK